MQSDGRWEWDDDNQTDLPIATTALTTDQQDYSLAVTHLSVKRIEILNASTGSTWIELTPFDQSELRGQSITEFMESAGIPTYYDKIGNSIFLYPPPDYTRAAGLKVYFQRPPALYTSAEVTTGTKVPGFNSLYHDLISFHAAHDYALANGLPNANQLMASIIQKEEALVSDYQMRNKDEQLVMRTRYNNPR